MTKIYVCQIFDSLSDRVINTFFAANYRHAKSLFKQFLDGLKPGTFDPTDFVCMILAKCDIMETSKDYSDVCDSSSFVDSIFAEDVLDVPKMEVSNEG